MSDYLSIVAGMEQRQPRRVLLGGVDFQSGSAKPTTRSDGSALQTGDRWLSTTDRYWYFWSGSYWLSEQIFIAQTSYVGITATTSLYCLPASSSFNYYLINSEISGAFSAHDASNYYTVSLELITTAGGVVSEFSYSSANTFATRTDTINSHRDLTALSAGSWRYRFAKQGSTASPAVSPTCVLYYRRAKP